VKVEQLMTRDVKVCREEDSLNRAAQLMWEADCGFIPIIRANGTGKVVGIVTDRDAAMAAYTQGKQLWAIPLTAVMTREIVTCRAEDGVGQAEALMRDKLVRRLPVLDGEEHLVGIISLNDIAREAQREAAIGKRAEVSSEGVVETLASVCQPRAAREVVLAA